MPVSISFEGRMTDDAELRFTPAGHAVANFSVAVNDRIKDPQTGEWKDGDATFMRCNAWRDMAENAVEKLGKGQLVFVEGRLKQRSYETKEGEKRTVYEVECDVLGPSLKWRDKDSRPPAKGSSYSDEPPF